jgi:hypothetical protein
MFREQFELHRNSEYNLVVTYYLIDNYNMCKSTMSDKDHLLLVILTIRTSTCTLPTKESIPCILLVTVAF